MRIGLAQLNCDPGNVGENLRRIVNAIADASARECDLLVLPEMSDTGYHMPAILETAGTWPGRAYSEIADAARRYQLTVAVGLSERVEGDVFNSVAVLGPDGELLTKYRKTHLITAEPVCEHRFLKAGRDRSLFPFRGFTVGIMTCYEVRFPEIARRYALDGADLLLVPAAFPQARIAHWRILSSARAIENQMYVAAVNRVGTDEGLTFGGSSQLIDPAGKILAAGNETDEALLVGELSRETIATVRSRLTVFQDRREELY